ncbi:MAG: hypothetical protein HN888_04525 [Desulfobacula sp.]|jgi:hypothetical protein|nr:hypothetical protein [Desulfobacula sp.]
MKLFATVSIYCENPAGVHRIMKKEFDTDVVPVAGMYLEDPAWEKEKEIGLVIVNPGENQYFMVLKEEDDRHVRCPDQLTCRRLEKVYQTHKWK